MAYEEESAALFFWTTAQVDAFEKRAKSWAETMYGETMQKSAAAVVNYTRIASFDQLLAAEKAFQKNDLTVYAQSPATLKSVQQGISDFSAGEAVYQQLLNDTPAYQAHKYRENEKAAPDKLVPLDAMRRALRGQVKRLENYRKNVMGNPHEHDFMSARVAMIRRAEELYDLMQRDRLC